MAKRIAPLTDTQLTRAKPLATRYPLRDGNGLELEIQPSGSKIWRYRYTRPNGSRTMATLGEYPANTLANARAWREECRALLAKGIDPQADYTKIGHSLRWVERFHKSCLMVTSYCP